jgi:drug/metabolite transporter (DMT)-like permease
MRELALGAAHGATHLRLIGMALLWGGSWPAGRYLAQHMPPLAASAWRFTIAVAILLAWVAARHGRLPRLSAQQSRAMFWGGAVGVFGYAVFFMYGLREVPASRAALVVTVNPVFTTLIAAWLFKEAFNWKIGVGIFIAALGAATVITHGAPWKLFVGAIGFGELLLLGCVACWVAYSLIGKAAMRDIEPLTATAYASAVGLALLWAASIVTEGAAAFAPVSAFTLAVLVVMAIGSTVLAYVWYNEGIAVLGAGVAASYISLVPVFGVGLSALLLNEPLDASIVVGGALAIGGLMWMNYARR